MPCAMEINFIFHGIPWCDMINPLGGAFNLAVKIVSHDFKSLISNTSKIMASSTTYYISCRDYKLLKCSIKRPKSPRPLTTHFPYLFYTSLSTWFSASLLFLPSIMPNIISISLYMFLSLLPTCIAEYINLTMQLHRGDGVLGWWQMREQRNQNLYQPESGTNKKALNDTLQLLLFNDRAAYGFLSIITGFG